jgi:hypothetical protein
VVSWGVPVKSHMIFSVNRVSMVLIAVLSVVASAALWVPLPTPAATLPNTGLARPESPLPRAAPRTAPSAPRPEQSDAHSTLGINLPMECRGLAILSAEILEYEGGLSETRCVLEGFLGQENVFVSALVDSAGTQVSTITASASRLSLFADEPHVPSVQASLEAIGFSVVREKYGARTLHVKLPPNFDFIQSLDLLASMLRGRAEVSLCPVDISP